MLNLTRGERLVIVFLSLSALLGVGISYYKKIHYRVDLKVEPFQITQSGIDIDRLIAKVKLVDINGATSEELMRLPGIGKTTAKKIIDYRNTHGHFKKIENITQVSGIGPHKFDSMKEFLIAQ